MADLATAFSGTAGIAFIVAAGIVFEIIAAACSSPQTAEINADSRAGTLMKWVRIGVGLAVFFVAVAAVLDRDKHPGALIFGGTLAAVIMYALYLHAKRAGLASGLPGTEGQ